jgi:transcriptional regulator with XRE-family HTH domain
MTLPKQHSSAGTRLALFRKQKGISQRQLGAAFGFSPGRVGQIECGSYPPSRQFLERISERYGVSADWLLNGHGAMLRETASDAPLKDRKIGLHDLDAARSHAATFQALRLRLSFSRLRAVSDRLEDGWLVPACSVALLFGILFVMLSIGGQP